MGNGRLSVLTAVSTGPHLNKHYQTCTTRLAVKHQSLGTKRFKQKDS